MKDQVVKHSGVIHVQHKVSLMGQQVFNVLLAYARKSLETGGIHKIAVKDILKHVPSAGNVTHLRKILKEMCAPIEYNIFGKNKEDIWGFFALLPYAEIPKGSGICEYSFTEKMIELLANPRMYAKINLLIQKRYSGNKYGWFLYELCFDYKEIGKTPKISIERLKHYFGMEETQYKQFRIFNQKVINMALKDLNKQTDLNVEAETFRTERKITHIQFHIKRKRGFKSPAPLSLEELPETLELIQKQEEPPRHPQDLNPPKEIPDVPNESPLAEELKMAGVAAVEIQPIIKDYSPERINEAIEACRETAELRGGVRNPTGFIKAALRDGWQSNAGLERRKKQAEDEKRRREEAAQKTREDREKEKLQTEEEKYASNTDEEKLTYVLERSPNLKTEYEALTPENQEKLKAYAYETFSYFHNFGHPIMHIYREAKDLRTRQR